MAVHAVKAHVGECEASPHTINLSGLICGHEMATAWFLQMVWGMRAVAKHWQRCQSPLGLVGVAGSILPMRLIIECLMGRCPFLTILCNDHVFYERSCARIYSL